MRATVGIIGAGPAGLLLSQLLHQGGVDSVVLEARTRSYVERRQRAGMLEQGTVDVLRAAGVGERLDREGLRHAGIELRFAGGGHRIDFPSRTDGRHVTIYAQTEIVKDLVERRVSDDGALLFEARAEQVCDPDSDHPSIRFTHAGRERVLHCDMVAGCDGFYGVSRAAIPPDVLRTSQRDYPYGWLGILADVPPSTDELIYAHHERGFALHSMRSPRVSRLYLQVRPDEDVAHWPAERIWSELDQRFAIPGWHLRHGPITDVSVTPMRGFMAEPMRFGKLFLAGDAAHIVPPTGAKGLNLAVADATILARALLRWARDGDSEGLERYSETCVRRAWQAQRFATMMTTLLHRPPDQSEFDHRLQLARLAWVVGSPSATTDLARHYTGLPYDSDS